MSKSAESLSGQGGWQISSCRNVHESQWIRVREYEANAPTGQKAVYGLVSFKNLAIAVLPIDEEGHTYLVGQHRFALGRYSLEVPEGGGNPECPPIEAAQREMSEETNLKAAEWLEVFSNVHMSNSVTDERAFGFVAWGLSPCHAYDPDDTERLDVQRVPIGQAVQMAVSGEISDALSLVILLKADHLWRTGNLPEALSRLFATGQV